MPLCVAAHRLLRPQEITDFGLGQVVELLGILKQNLELLGIMEDHTSLQHTRPVFGFPLMSGSSRRQREVPDGRAQ